VARRSKARAVYGCYSFATERSGYSCTFTDLTAGEAARFYRQSGGCRPPRRTDHSQAGCPVLSDPADDPVPYTAAAGAADILCTLNTRHFSSPAVGAFCEEHGIRVMTELDILRELFGRGGSGGQA
jgi:hypothetical protein